MKLVVCFPGIGYHCDKPLLYYSRKLAATAGYDHAVLLQYTCQKDGLRENPAALRAAFDALYTQAEAQLAAVGWAQYDDVLFFSKASARPLPPPTPKSTPCPAATCCTRRWP